MRASGDNFDAFLKRVESYLPENFTQDLYDDGLGQVTTSFIFVAFMRDGTADRCAADLMQKLGVEGE